MVMQTGSMGPSGETGKHESCKTNDDSRDSNSNPLLFAWHKEFGPTAPYKWRDRMIRHEWQSEDPRREVRRWMISRYSFAVPTDEALDVVGAFSPLVEIGAGIGYWASLLRGRGCDVVAYDIMESEFQRWFACRDAPGVIRGGADMAAAHPGRTLMIVWPPHGDGMATEALREYQDAGGRRLVYVGEPRYGFTADESFFDELGGARGWLLSAELDIPQWPRCNDRLLIYERRI